MLASEHAISHARIVFWLQSPARPHSDRKGDLLQLQSKEHGNARDFWFPRCVCIIYHSLIFQWIIRKGSVLILSFTITQTQYEGFNVVSFLICVCVRERFHFAAVYIFCLFGCSLFSIFLKFFFLNKQSPNVCIHLKMTRTPWSKMHSLLTVDFKRQHIYWTFSEIQSADS